jgi:hypothetical protein
MLPEKDSENSLGSCISAKKNSSKMQRLSKSNSKVYYRGTVGGKEKSVSCSPRGKWEQRLLEHNSVNRSSSLTK